MKKLKNAKPFTNKDLRGDNIYQTKNSNQTIYYDRLSKTAFIIPNRDALFFKTWQLRLPICLIAIGIILVFMKNFTLAIIVGASLYVVSSILFRILFLNKLPISTTFKKPESLGFIRDIAKKYTKNALELVAILFGSMGLSLVVNQILRPIEGSKKPLVFIFMILSIVVTLLVAYIIHIKKKEKL